MLSVHRHPTTFTRAQVHTRASAHTGPYREVHAETSAHGGTHVHTSTDMCTGTHVFHRAFLLPIRVLSRFFCSVDKQSARPWNGPDTRKPRF